MNKTRYSIILCSVLLLCLALSSCILLSTRVKPLNKRDVSVVNSPTKVHLYDGSVIVFDSGFGIRNNVLFGNGIRHNLTRDSSVAAESVPLDSVAFLEYYQKGIEAGPLFGGIPGAIGLGTAAVYGGLFLYKAIFGSCPTVYSYDGENYSLQAECFTHSFAPGFEREDLDRIDAGKALENKYLLKITDEALETHYINEMKLLVVDHPQGYEAFPSDRQFLLADDKIVLFGSSEMLLKATDKKGHDVLDIVQTRDSQYYRSDSAVVQELTRDVMEDWIEIEVEIPEGATEMYVAFRFRNTLLNSLMLYDVILQSNKAEAIDWLGIESNDIGYAYSLYKDYKKYFGLRLQMWNGEQFETKAWLRDAGPIVWRNAAAEMPVPQGDHARLRFSYLPDNWMIDWIGVSFDVSDDCTISEIECCEIEKLGNEDLTVSPSLISRNDKQYLVTYPGDSYLLSFNVDDVPEGFSRSYFLKSKGFYCEWIRNDWLFAADSIKGDDRFELNETILTKTAQLWLAKKAGFEKQFFESRIYQKAGGGQ